MQLEAMRNALSQSAASKSSIHFKNNNTVQYYLHHRFWDTSRQIFESIQISRISTRKVVDFIASLSKIFDIRVHVTGPIFFAAIILSQFYDSSHKEFHIPLANLCLSIACVRDNAFWQSNLMALKLSYGLLNSIYNTSHPSRNLNKECPSSALSKVKHVCQAELKQAGLHWWAVNNNGQV